MPTYKLIYFDLRARAETARYMFELAGVKYEDKRVNQEEWQKIKPNTGLGQLPVLEVDGKQLPQSGAISRYIARMHGFYPSDAAECAKVDVVSETVADFDPDLRKIFMEKDEAKKAEVIKTILTEAAPKRFAHLEQLLKKNKDGKGWFVGDKISLADVNVFSMLHDMLPALTGQKVGCLDLKNHQLLAAFVGRFKAQKKISAWIEKRPVTSF